MSIQQLGEQILSSDKIQNEFINMGLNPIEIFAFMNDLMLDLETNTEIQNLIIQKEAIQNRTNMIWELQQYITIAKEDIYQEEVIDFTDKDLNNKICESIEEFNENAIWCEKEYSSNPCEKFYHILLHNITNNF